MAGKLLLPTVYEPISFDEQVDWETHHLRRAAERDGVKVVVGIEDRFSGAKYIRRRFGQDCPDVPIVATLEETCRAVVEIVSG